MAKATREMQDVIVTKQEEVIVLTLSKFEAECLLAVCSKIGGDTPQRKVFSDTPESIYQMLKTQGVEQRRDILNTISTVYPSIHFIEHL